MSFSRIMSTLRFVVCASKFNDGDESYYVRRIRVDWLNIRIIIKNFMDDRVREWYS